MMRMYATAALLALMELIVTAIAQQNPLQFNVPYKCPDGSTYVIHKCEMGPKFEVCYLQRDQDSEAYNNRKRVEEEFLNCKVIGSPVPTAPAKSADYTDDMPSVDQVKAAIKGSDPGDTLVRQYAAFIGLNKHIFDIKVERTVSGSYTPSELRVRNAYDLAKNQIEQEYAKSHTPEQMAGFNRLWFRYTMDEDLYQTWNKLIGPKSRAAIKSTQDANSARGKAYYDNAMDLIGFGTKTQEALSGPGRAGVVLSGFYKNPATTAALGFGENNVSINGCGKLVADPHNYTIDKRPGSIRVTVENEPSPIMLTMRPDGGFTGPGLITVTGLILTGYHTQTSTLMINGVRAAPDQCDGPCQTSTRVPDYAPATARCTIGSLSKPPDPKPAPASAQPADNSGIMGLATGLTDMMAPGGGAPGAIEVGLRMTGKYSDGRLLLDFT